MPTCCRSISAIFPQRCAGYVGEIKRLAGRESDAIRERNREIAEGVFSAALRPQPSLGGAAAGGRAAATQFCAARRRARRTRSRRRSLPAELGAGRRRPAAHRWRTAALDKVNEELLRSERALTDPNGLPGRPWYKHQLYAPGFYTGYGVKTIPAVREAIEQKQWALAQQSIVSVAKVIAGEAAAVERAATDLDGALR